MRPVSASCAGIPCSWTPSPAGSRRCPFRRGRPGGRQPCPLGGHGGHPPTCVPAGRDRVARRRRHRGYCRPGPDGCARRGRCRSQGARAGTGQAAVRGEPPRCPRRRRCAGAWTAAGADDGVTGFRWPLLAPAGPRHHRRSSSWDVPSTTLRGRPSTRWLGCSVCLSRADRTLTGWPEGRSEVAIDFPRGLSSARDLQRHRFDVWFSGLKTAVARWVEARGLPASRFRSRTSRPPSRRRCGRATRKAVDAATTRDRGHPDRRRGGGELPVARPGRATGQRGIGVRVPRPGLCTDNGAMVAALGAEMVSRGREPSSLDLPADSSMPVEHVLA